MIAKPLIKCLHKCKRATFLCTTPLLYCVRPTSTNQINKASFWDKHCNLKPTKWDHKQHQQRNCFYKGIYYISFGTDQSILSRGNNRQPKIRWVIIIILTLSDQKPRNALITFDC